MQQNYKFHAIAIAILCVVITLLYFLFGPSSKPPVAAASQSGRAIEIYSATWGANCAREIRQAQAEQATTVLEKDAQGLAVPRKPILDVVPNNVLPKLKELCGGKTVCELAPTSTTLDNDPLQTCSKNLDVSYRCFNYDRLWNLNIPQGKSMTINCNETADASRK